MHQADILAATQATLRRRLAEIGATDTAESSAIRIELARRLGCCTR